MGKLGLDPVPYNNPVETFYHSRKKSIQLSIKMDSQGEMNPVQHENGLEWIKFLTPYLNIPVKEIITNWIDELLGLAAA